MFEGLLNILVYILYCCVNMYARHLISCNCICYNIDFHSFKLLLSGLTSPLSADRVPPLLEVPSLDWRAAYSDGGVFTAWPPPLAPSIFNHCDLIKPPYVTAQSEALIHLCD